MRRSPSCASTSRPRHWPWPAPTSAAARGCWPTFTCVLARMLGNQVLAELLEDLLTRSSLIALMYQSSHSAEHSQRRACGHRRRAGKARRPRRGAAARIAPRQRRAQPAAEPACRRPGHGAPTRLKRRPLTRKFHHGPSPRPRRPALCARPARLRPPGAARALARRREDRRAVRAQLRRRRREQRAARRPDVRDLPVRAGHRAGLREPPHDDGVDLRVRLARRRLAHPARVRAARAAAHRVRRGHRRWSATPSCCRPSWTRATRSPTTGCAGSTTRTCPKAPSAAMSAWPRTC